MMSGRSNYLCEYERITGKCCREFGFVCVFFFADLDLILFEAGDFYGGLGFRGPHSFLEFSGSCSIYILIHKILILQLVFTTRVFGFLM